MRPNQHEEVVADADTVVVVAVVADAIVVDIVVAVVALKRKSMSCYSILKHQNVVAVVYRHITGAEQLDRCVCV